MAEYAAMLGGDLTLNRPEWLWMASLLALLALAGVAWGYRKTAARPGVRLACALLKLLGLAALAACLVEPHWISQRAKPGANYLAVVADNSESLTLRDRPETRTRADQLRGWVTGSGAGWLASLEPEFQVRRYQFDARLEATDDFAKLTFDGRASAFGAALRSLGDRFRGQPLAGIIVLTDGNATDLAEGVVDTRGLPPVYPVVLGRPEPPRDLSLASVRVDQTPFEDAPVTIQTEVATPGFAGERIQLRLLDARGLKLVEQTERAPAGNRTLPFRLQWKPAASGLLFCRLEVGLAGDSASATAGDAASEATLANNARWIALDCGSLTRRVLYVAGRPNWEYKFLNRALADDDRLQLVGMIRLARREPKFEFRGRGGEVSNPLFRGFDRKTEETERYDQPVLIRLNTRDATELAGGFPKTPEELFAYHAVVVDDLEAAFFTRDQLSLLRRFVAERGGALLMLGGAESFQAGGYESTPLADVLPVYLERLPDRPPPENLKLALTREGWLTPWARLRSQETEEQKRLAELTPLEVLNPVRRVKPGATVLAEVVDRARERHPALVAQRFGLGRVGALLVGDFWRWGMGEESLQADLAKAWRQTVRWLVAEVPEPVEIEAAPLPGHSAGAWQLTVRARDRDFQGMDNADVQVSVRPFAEDTAATNPAVRLAVEPSSRGPGQYETTFVAREPGGYVAETIVRDPTGREVGRAQTGWSVDPAADEWRSLTPNRALLANVARATGGELLEPDRLADLAKRLPRQAAPVSETWSRPLWHQPTLFLFAIGCFVAEWGLRRWRGLA